MKRREHRERGSAGGELFSALSAAGLASGALLWTVAHLQNGSVQTLVARFAHA